MKKLFIAIIAVFLLAACETGTSKITPDADDTSITKDTPTNVQNTVVARIPSFIPAATSSRNVYLENVNALGEFLAGVGPILITDWSSSQEVSKGATFTKDVYGNTVTFTVSINEEKGNVVYSGLFPDGEGKIDITYYPSTNTFDIAYRVIYDIHPAVELNICAYMGEMYGAQITETGGYTGQYFVSIYHLQHFNPDPFGMDYDVPVEFDGSILDSYRYSLTASSESVIALRTACLQSRNNSASRTFPSIQPLVYEGTFWNDMLQTKNFSELTYDEYINGSSAQDEWLVYADVGSNNLQYTFIDGKCNGAINIEP